MDNNHNIHVQYHDFALIQLFNIKEYYSSLKYLFYLWIKLNTISVTNLKRLTLNKCVRVGWGCLMVYVMLKQIQIGILTFEKI